MSKNLGEAMQALRDYAETLDEMGETFTAMHGPFKGRMTTELIGNQISLYGALQYLGDLVIKSDPGAQPQVELVISLVSEHSYRSAMKLINGFGFVPELGIETKVDEEFVRAAQKLFIESVERLP